VVALEVGFSIIRLATDKFRIVQTMKINPGIGQLGQVAGQPCMIGVGMDNDDPPNIPRESPAIRIPPSTASGPSRVLTPVSIKVGTVSRM
jgi:hypothetical protein